MRVCVSVCVWCSYVFVSTRLITVCLENIALLCSIA